MPKQLNEAKIELQRAMAMVINSAGYKAMAKDVRHGKNVEENVKHFLKLYKRLNYGFQWYDTKTDGSRRVGKISPEHRAHYDYVEKKMLNALKQWNKWC